MLHEPKQMSYSERLAYAQRIAKTAQYRTDPKLAIRELCEAITELIAAIMERDQGQTPPDAGAKPATP
jgi:hypothetical protein